MLMSMYGYNFIITMYKAQVDINLPYILGHEARDVNIEGQKFFPRLSW